MARQRGRPREQPKDLVYLRLAVTPEEHRQIQVAAGLAGMSMAQFARRAVTEEARAKIVASGIDPMRLPEAVGEGAEGGGGGAPREGAASKEGGDTKGQRGKKQSPSTG